METYTAKNIFDKLMDEQTAKFSASLQGDLVERMEESTKEEHLQLLQEIEHSAEAQKPPKTAYQQMEIGRRASICDIAVLIRDYIYSKSLS